MTSEDMPLVKAACAGKGQPGLGGLNERARAQAG